LPGEQKHQGRNKGDDARNKDKKYSAVHLMPTHFCVGIR
jgi:hypothetical protein